MKAKKLLIAIKKRYEEKVKKQETTDEIVDRIMKPFKLESKEFDNILKEHRLKEEITDQKLQESNKNFKEREEKINNYLNKVDEMQNIQKRLKELRNLKEIYDKPRKKQP